MIVIPAIDLYQGKVVRFVKGNPNQCKIYSNNPIEVVKKWERKGAEFLHIVDLSSALGEKNNLEIIMNILGKAKVKVEIGGGIRDVERAKKLVSLGAERIVVGSKALDDVFLNKIIKSLGKERVAVSVDVVNSSLVVEGWKRKTKIKSLDFISQLKDKGIEWVIYTDVSRDGTLEGPNYREIEKLASFKEMKIIFSGGISSIDDLKRIKKHSSFLWGVILGKALYEGKIDLSMSLSLFESL
jgi:phosphoribosylformimino-5-aminoimidazole carboxamide ribotide isomerase